MPAVYGARLTTFEDAEKESEYGYVRKVRTIIIIIFFPIELCVTELDAEFEFENDWIGCGQFLD